MSWVSDHIRNEQEKEKNRALVRSKAPRLYQELWEEIAQLAEEARNCGLPIGTNGSEFERVVLRMPLANSPHREATRLTISLPNTRDKVIAESEERTTEMVLGVCPDGVVCFEYEGKQLRINEAARLILEPFLFPPTT